MKMFTVFLFLFCLVGFGYGQKDVNALKTQLKTFKETNDRQYKIKYDKFEDKTSVIWLGDVLTSGFSLAWSGQMIQLIGGFEFTGEKLDHDITDFTLIFHVTGKDWEFLKNQHLYAIADGERMDLGKGGLDTDITHNFLGEYNTKEDLYFPLSRENLSKFASAKSLEIKVGEKVFKLKSSAQKGFNNLLLLGSSSQ